MTTYELAQQLLAGPNLPVYVYNEDASAPDPVERVQVTTEMFHHYTDQLLTKDAEGQPLPSHYVMVY